MNGNVTKDGIKRDFEWMKRIGIGGVQCFDGAVQACQVVASRLVYMTPEWMDAFSFAAEQAGRLGLEFGIASSPGWSETGGPWVKPQDSMKKLVWSLTPITGGRRFRSRLPDPPSCPGPYQDLPVRPLKDKERFGEARFYRDICVLAYPTPAALIDNPAPAKVTVCDSEPGRPRVLGGGFREPVSLRCCGERPAWVLFEYAGLQNFRAASLAAATAASFSYSLEFSDDGVEFHGLTEFPRDFLRRRSTISFPVVRARFFRVLIRTAPLPEPFEKGANAPGAAILQSRTACEHASLEELTFYSGARINRFEDKAGFQVARAYYAIDSGPNEPEEAVSPNAVLDISKSINFRGELEWQPPEGDWTILRLGYSLTGKTNHPACPEATGLEVDKLDARAVKAYLDEYLTLFEKAVGVQGIGERGIYTFVTDSIESAGQNWTPALIDTFRAQRGYDPVPWLPALTGVIVGDAARSDRFMWDFRKTLMELMSAAHYGQIAASVHQRGLQYYAESLEGYFMMAMGDDLDMRQHADVPMGAMWTSFNSRQRDGLLCHVADIRGAASVGHVFGKQVIAAESLTSTYEPWAFSPVTLRPIIDLVFALGANLPVIHSCVHQPCEEKPGITLGHYGQQFSRHETWADLATPWITYLARCAFLLQQGKFVADVAWFYGEEGSLASLYAQAEPDDLPRGYGFDFISANMLINHLKADGARLLSPGGASYRLLYLGGSSQRMTFTVLRKLKDLSDHGVAIAGRRPRGSPSLADDARVEEYDLLVKELWDGGRVSAHLHPNDRLASLGIAPDFEYETGVSESIVMHVHRRLPEGHIYFLTNRKPRAERIEARFRVAGWKPELWRAENGTREPLACRIENEYTEIRLEFRPNESFFVVFRESTVKVIDEVEAVSTVPVLTFDGEWLLTFGSSPDAPEGAISTLLMSWTASERHEVKYFSGIGTYSKDFIFCTDNLNERERVILDLGRVHDLAEVLLNERPIGIAWHEPYELDVTEALKPGVNRLVVRVANLWVNRLIGDTQPGMKRVSFTTTTTYNPSAPLRESGLIGPVVLKRRWKAAPAAEGTARAQ